MADRTTEPAYKRVAADLRAKIEAGDYGPGSALPSERTLTETYGVSRPTIREALGLLRTEGVVTIEHGRGVFVRPPTTVIRLARNRLSKAAHDRNEGAFMADAKASDFTPSSSVRVYFERADATTAEALGVPDGTEVTVRDRTMRANGLIVQLAVSRLPRELTRGTAIEDVDTGAGGMYARLEDAGHAPVRFTEIVSTRMPTPDEARALELGGGVPVITITRVAFDKSGTALEVNDMVLAGDRYALTYELPAD